MKYIDMENWPRRKHFEMFNGMDYPHFSLCANMDISKLCPYLKERGISFFGTILYIASKSANSIQEFRYRINDGRVIEHPVVHPSFTVMTDKEAFSFCMVDFVDDIYEFLKNVKSGKKLAEECINLEDEPGRSDLLYITSIPWVSFTSLVHPIHMHPADSVPRISWGKYFEDCGKLKMPLSVQVHHALMDGLHAGRYFNYFQDLLDRPETIFE